MIATFSTWVYVEGFRILLEEGLWEAELSNSRTWALTCEGKKNKPAYDFHLSPQNSFNSYADISSIFSPSK
jgi:hypothetical protein